MVKARLITLIAAAAAACSCCGSYSWQSYPMDGHRTGVTAPNADNVVQALGTVEGDVYTSPNGTVFNGGAVTAVAKKMLDVQPRMADLKKVIGHSSMEMLRYGPECELSNWIVDHIAEDVAATTGKKVDVGLINLGGIRVDLPAGDVILDDMVSMLPFKNYLCYVALKGEDLLNVFEFMAQTYPQCLSGVKFVVKNHKIDTLLIGGEELDPEKIYGVGTIDFLLDGGDGFTVAKNCKDLVMTDKKVIDSMLPYAMSYAEQGKPIEYFKDGRVVVINEGEE